jgi:hypothetical protein
LARTLHDVLADLVAVAELQLQAAVSINSEALSEATAARQDLLFELRLFSEAERSAFSRRAEARELLAQLDELDARSSTVLELGLDVINGLRPDRGATTTYRPNGRTTGSTS